MGKTKNTAIARLTSSRRFWLPYLPLLAFLALGSQTGIYNRIPLITLFRFPANWTLLFILCSFGLIARGAASLRPVWVQGLVILLLSLDLLSYSRRTRSPWVPESYLTERPRVVKGFRAPRSTKRIFHTEDVGNSFADASVRKNPDWNLYMDGIKEQILVLDETLLAAFVPEGVHRVRFKYEPWTYRLGLALPLATAAALFLIQLYRRRSV